MLARAVRRRRLCSCEDSGLFSSRPIGSSYRYWNKQLMHVRRPPITDRRIRFALIGCGRIAQNHFEAIKRHSQRCELTDVCDVDPVALQDAVNKTGAKGYPTLSALLAQSEADCVVLTTPSGLHPTQATEAANADFNVDRKSVV